MTAIKPMLAWDSRGDFTVVPASGYVMEPKRDGFRWQAEITADGVTHTIGRNGNTNSYPLKEIDFALIHLPVGTVLDGELVCEGANSPAVGSALVHCPDRLEFIIFDVLMIGGHSCLQQPWYSRRAVLEILGARLEGLDTSSVSVSPCAPASAELHATYLAVGAEGSVCKRENSTYRPGSRSRDWIKVKPQQTAHVKIIGFDAGKGQSNGSRCGALKIRMADSGVETTCGYDSKFAEAGALCGRMAQIRHHGIMASGKPRHPIFDRLRPDLEA